MGDTTTPRLTLHPLGLDEARRVLARSPGPHDHWAADYPFADELDVLPMFIDTFVEHDSVPGQAFPGHMDDLGGGEWRLSERPERLPHSYTLVATRRD